MVWLPAVQALQITMSTCICHGQVGRPDAEAAGRRQKETGSAIALPVFLWMLVF